MAVVSNRTPCNNKMFLKEINIPLINLIDKRRLFEFLFLLTTLREDCKCGLYNENGKETALTFMEISKYNK